MTVGDRQRFAVVLGWMAETFAEALSPARVEGYFRALADLEIGEVEAAVRVCMRTSKFFPKPAEFWEALNGSPEDGAELAWVRFLGAVRDLGAYESVDFGDPVIHAVVTDMWGDWPQACRLETNEVPFRHQDFVKLYRVRARQGGDLRQGHLVGLVEADNRRCGFLAYLPPVVKLGQKALKPTGSAPAVALVGSR